MNNPNIEQGKPMTTTHDRRWPLATALPVARGLLDTLTPSCERIVIAGSIRREKSTVGDIELLCIPKRIPQAPDLWGNVAQGPDLLEAVLAQLIKGCVLAHSPNKNGIISYGPLNKRLVHIPSGIRVDVFSTNAANWGMALVVRTGPKDFNIRMMSRFCQLRMKGHAYGGVTSASGHEIYCPNEDDVFRLLGWPYQMPAQREGIVGDG